MKSGDLTRTVAPPLRERRRMTCSTKQGLSKVSAGSRRGITSRTHKIEDEHDDFMDADVNAEV